MEHKTKIEGFSNMKELATAVGNLRYDVLQEFLKALSEKLFSDSEADEKRERFKLASVLCDAHDSITTAFDEIEKAWKICKPHMDIKNDK